MILRAAEAGLEDAILVNTCAVTAEAVRQARQAIRKARREHPGKAIVVSGCAAQTEPETFAAMPEVDLVLGNAEKLTAEAYRGALPSSLRGGVAPASPDGARPHPAGTSRRSVPSTLSPQGGERSGLAIPPHEKILVGDIMAVRETAAHLADGFAAPDADIGATRARAFVQVQNGCDHRCTFCVIPYGRGNSRSVPMGAVVDAVRRLVAKAASREVVLTGVDVTAYGADLPGRPRLGRSCGRS